MSVLEKKTENEVVDWAQAHGFLTPKVRFVENGYPDRMFISPYGHTPFIEFKREGELPSKLQLYRMSSLVAHKIPATWSDNAAESIRFLETCLESAPISATSHQAPSKSGSGRIIPGPWAREDLNIAGNLQDPKGEGVGQANVDSGSLETLLQGVAGRDPEMAELLGPVLDHLARKRQRREFDW